MDITEISGGICAAKGFSANGICCGIKKNSTKADLALIYSQKKAAAAAVYTTNLVYGAPITVTRNNIADGYAQAVICNSGNANTCNANGIEIVEQMCSLAAAELNIDAKDVIVASTGVIGCPLNIDPIASGMGKLAAGLGDHSDSASRAIMTTDLVPKEIAVSFMLSGKECHLGGIAKGSGMIHPNMATMLGFLTTDAAISPKMLQSALQDDVKDTFNMISVDGDTSTNDMVAIMANGMAENPEIVSEGADYAVFKQALNYVTKYLSRQIAGDGEGATKLLECHVSKAKDKEAAVKISKSVICSSLVKAAMFGEDANWGRVLCAIGYSGADVDVHKVDLSFSSAAGNIQVCANGSGIEFSEEKAAEILHEKEIQINITLGDGEAEACAWGCDLTYDYVKINGDYRT